ncbi:MAG: HD domain-containing protein [Bacteroidetes bacterium]|nr:MAG: HD domain-containing protein [Bacteroidota bacterium]
MNTHSLLLSQAEAYATELLEQQLDKGYRYHTYEHTRQVVDASEQIGRQAGLREEEVELIKIAAWFHDLGYLKRYIGHEEDSREIARRFLLEREADQIALNVIDGLISATRLDKEPSNTLEEVIKDADLYNLATPQALENSQLIREEWFSFCERQYSDEDWDELNYRFFKEHSYYTKWAQEELEPLKQDNIRQLKKNIKKRRKMVEQSEQAVLISKIELQEEHMQDLRKKIKKLRKQQPGRGIETMFRTTYRTHISLSDLADNKANILLSINAIIISIIFSAVVVEQKAVIFKNGIYPILMILVVCMTTIVCAVLATRPKVSSGKFTRDDILEKKTNLLFFGNFHRMNLTDYQWGIDQMMKDADYLYGSMSKDIYFLGKVLAQKFQLLRLAYNIFMYGMGASILAFIITYIASR